VENLVIQPDFWRNKRVFLTGHTGFKGSWLAFWLSTLGADVIGYSLSDPPSQPNHYALLNLPIRSIAGDVRDLKGLTTALQTHQPEIVFHFAAQAFVRRSYTEPVETFETNVIGTVNVLEACRTLSSVKAVVAITSDKCYDNQEWVWGYRENDPLGGYDPYSASKGCAELVIASYRNAFFHPTRYGLSHHLLLASCRTGNVIGGGDWGEDRLIPDIIHAAIQHETLQIRSPYAIRPWQHVLEPLSGYLHVGQKLFAGEPEYAEAWNFGPSHEEVMTVQEVVQCAQQFWPTLAYHVDQDAGHVHEASTLTLDCSKARHRLHWKPRWNLATTLQHTFEWYRVFYENGVLLTQQQLQAYVGTI
jgi:CDP-glucose 4,6-dehydratase